MATKPQSSDTSNDASAKKNNDRLKQLEANAWIRVEKAFQDAGGKLPIPAGWTLQAKKRESSARGDIGKFDYFYFDPNGKRYRSQRDAISIMIASQENGTAAGGSVPVREKPRDKEGTEPPKNASLATRVEALVALAVTRQAEAAAAAKAAGGKATAPGNTGSKPSGGGAGVMGLKPSGAGAFNNSSKPSGAGTTNGQTEKKTAAAAAPPPSPPVPRPPAGSQSVDAKGSRKRKPEIKLEETENESKKRKPTKAADTEEAFAKPQGLPATRQAYMNTGSYSEYSYSLGSQASEFFRELDEEDDYEVSDYGPCMLAFRLARAVEKHREAAAAAAVAAARGSPAAGLPDSAANVAHEGTVLLDLLADTAAGNDGKPGDMVDVGVQEQNNVDNSKKPTESNEVAAEGKQPEDSVCVAADQEDTNTKPVEPPHKLDGQATAADIIPDTSNASNISNISTITNGPPHRPAPTTIQPAQGDCSMSPEEAPRTHQGEAAAPLHTTCTHDHEGSPSVDSTPNDQLPDGKPATDAMEIDEKQSELKDDGPATQPEANGEPSKAPEQNGQTADKAVTNGDKDAGKASLGKQDSGSCEKPHRKESGHLSREVAQLMPKDDELMIFEHFKWEDDPNYRPTRRLTRAATGHTPTGRASENGKKNDAGKCGNNTKQNTPTVQAKANGNKHFGLSADLNKKTQEKSTPVVVKMEADDKPINDEDAALVLAEGLAVASRRRRVHAHAATQRHAARLLHSVEPTMQGMLKVVEGLQAAGLQGQALDDFNKAVRRVRGAVRILSSVSQLMALPNSRS